MATSIPSNPRVVHCRPRRHLCSSDSSRSEGQRRTQMKMHVAVNHNRLPFSFCPTIATCSSQKKLRCPTVRHGKAGEVHHRSEARGGASEHEFVGLANSISSVRHKSRPPRPGIFFFRERAHFRTKVESCSAPTRVGPCGDGDCAQIRGACHHLILKSPTHRHGVSKFRSVLSVL